MKIQIANNVFERMYVYLDPCKRGFLAGCRPLIGIDCCHLKGTTEGQLLVAVGKDGNDNIFPIAYAIVEIENKSSWTWILQCLLDDIGIWTWMRMDGSLSQTNRKQETINVHVNFLFYFKYPDL